MPNVLLVVSRKIIHDIITHAIFWTIYHLHEMTSRHFEQGSTVSLVKKPTAIHHHHHHHHHHQHHHPIALRASRHIRPRLFVNRFTVYIALLLVLFVSCWVIDGG